MVLCDTFAEIFADVNQCKHAPVVLACVCKSSTIATSHGAERHKAEHFISNTVEEEKKTEQKLWDKSQQFRHIAARVKVHCMLNSLWVYELFLRHTFHICLITNFTGIRANDEKKKVAKHKNTKQQQQQHTFSEIRFISMFWMSLGKFHLWNRSVCL